MPADPAPPTADARDATLRRLLRIAWSYRADCLQLLGLQLAVVFLTVAVIALAGIAHPDAFFDMLKGRGLELAGTISLPDHFDFSQYTLPVQAGTTVLCTEKDAVKLFKLPTSAAFRLLAVPLEFAPEPEFLRAMDDLLAPLLRRPSSTNIVT